MKNMRFFMVDCIRFLAIILLLTAHILQTLGYNFHFSPNVYIDISPGGTAVILFLLLSGLLLELKYGNASLDYRRFILKRLIHIYSTYGICLIIALGVFILKIFLAGNPDVYNIHAFTLQNLTCSVFGVCSFVGLYGGPFLNTSWFIALIVSLYILFPLLSRFIHTYGSKGIMLIAFLSLIVNYALITYQIFPKNYISQSWFPFARMAEFSLGIFLAYRYKNQLMDMGKNVKSNTIVTSISKISFALFLIHTIFLFLIVELQKLGIPLFISIGIYISFCCILSWGVTKAASKVKMLLTNLLQ